MATVKAIGIFGDVAVALTPPVPVPAASYAPDDTVPPGPASTDINQIMDRVDSIGASVSVLTKALEEKSCRRGRSRTSTRSWRPRRRCRRKCRRSSPSRTRISRQTLESFRDAAGHISNMADSAQIAATLDNHAAHHREHGAVGGQPRFDERADCKAVDSGAERERDGRQAAQRHAALFRRAPPSRRWTRCSPTSRRTRRSTSTLESSNVVMSAKVATSLWL